MVPTLSSNSSLFPTTPHSRLNFRNQTRFNVYAKKSGGGSFPSFGLGKPKDEEKDGSSSNSNNPFGFDFGKLPDVTSLIPVGSKNSSLPGLSFGSPRRKDSSTVFVAGATGQAGIRIAQTLLREGFSVRAGVPELGSAQELAQLASQYKVTKSKIASLVSDVFSNTQVAENKVVQVYSDPNAPLKRVDELFSTIPEDGRRKVYAETLEKAKAEEEERVAAEKAREEAETIKKEEEVIKLSKKGAQASNVAKEAKEKVEAAGPSVDDILNKAKDFSSGFSWQKFSLQVVTIPKPDEDEEPKVKVATVRGQAKARSLSPNKVVTKQTTPKSSQSKPKEEKVKVAEKPKEVRKVFGGLFKQETIYVDDD